MLVGGRAQSLANFPYSFFVFENKMTITTSTATSSSSSSSSSSSGRVGIMEEAFIVAGLIGVQIIYAVYMLFLHRFLSLGVNSLSLVIFGGLASAMLLLPFAVVVEKKKWPAKLRPVLMVQLLVISVAGVIFQVLMLYGVKMTSPAVASAMPNLGPVIIFIISACVRFERFTIYCKYSRAKIFGTILCLSGAIAMSFLMSPPSPISSTTTLSRHLFSSVSREWILGCFYLLLAIIFLSCNTVLQAATMVSFPAPLSLCVVTSLMGSILAAIMQFAMEGNLNFGTSSLSFKAILGIVLLGAVITGACVTFQTWCLNKKGPVMVSIFSPIQTVFSAVLSAFILGQDISLGSLAGMLLMFVGLYVVLWAKKKEDLMTKDADDVETNHDIEKPLLS